jgi:signal transduction histidine kinase
MLSINKKILLKRKFVINLKDMPENLNFRISSALKDIIGRDLITDDYIAVFELVKNSYDAYASQVDIYFENIYSANSKIIIKDNGKGMDYDDLYDKWLFVAYSAKKAGKEDENFDYRDSIYRNRPFAGAKGIGRFSCDRLGKMLYLETTKKSNNPKTESLITDWGKFETDINEEFVDVTIIHETKESNSYELHHGTVLEITELRSQWTRFDLLKLKDSLAKLINPSSGEDEIGFKIIIHVDEEQKTDDSKAEAYEKVNGEVRNFIFEALDVRTTKIHASISDDNKTIITELYDRDTLIYRIKEPNNYNLLEKIGFTIYYMNLSAKHIFTRRMGLSVNRFGHIFLYKNGFRVYPYGEPGEDSFKIDARKAQGRNRYLGTGEMIGRIEIFANNGDNDDTSRQLKETTSRGDGLIKTKAYYQLEECFFEVLKRLEKYVVDVQQWGISIEDESSFGLKSRASDLLAKLTDSNNIIDFETSENFFEILEASQSNSADTIVRNLQKIALESENEALIEQASRAVNKLVEIQYARLEAEKQADEEQKKALEATEKLREQVSENLFLKSINTSEFQEVISLLHHIGIYAGTIDSNLKGISLRVQNSIPLTNDELYDIIRSISFETKKILNIAAFATKANFKLDTEQIEINLNDYIREYIQNIIPTTTDKSLNIKVTRLNNNPFIRKLKPIEMNIVIDNLISNSKKAKATELEIQLNENQDGKFEMKFIDNGVGIEEENLKRIYDFGYTTTDGSGIGLYHVKEIVKSFGGTIKAENNIEAKGLTFTIDIK